MSHVCDDLQQHQDASIPEMKRNKKLVHAHRCSLILQFCRQVAVIAYCTLFNYKSKIEDIWRSMLLNLCSVDTLNQGWNSISAESVGPHGLVELNSSSLKIRTNGRGMSLRSSGYILRTCFEV